MEYHQTIQLSSWNIHGIKSKLLGNKLSDRDFLKEIINDDILSIVETHVHNGNEEELNIPGFHCIKHKSRFKHKNSNKGSGGLAVFIKPSLLKYVLPINNTNENSIWIKIKKEIFGWTNDIFIGTVYLPPRKNSNDNSKKIFELFEEILTFQGKGEVVLQGDFNSRTNIDNDIITPDEFDNSEIPNDHTNIPLRNSEDLTPSDHRGKELLELCKSLSLSILNGRKTGDVYGKCTSFQWNGNSVVDYVIASHSLYRDIKYFEVGNYLPWLSDHCALKYKLCASSSNLDKLENDDTSYEKFESIHWGENSHEKFKEGLRSCESEIAKLLETPQNEARNILEAFKCIIAKTTKTAKLKKKKKFEDKDPPWFDQECKTTKSELKSKSKQLQKHPHDQDLRTSLHGKKKDLKKLTRSKKLKHAQNILDEMYYMKNANDSKRFWQSLNRLSDGKKPDFISKISPKSWIEHFEKIRNNENEPNYPPDSAEEGPLDYEITLDELLEASKILKKGKASGSDMISYEMLKCILEVKPLLLIFIFNAALQHNPEVLDWFISIISPIHKKGSKMIPNNYRGISLISCVYKLFTSILRKRLEEYCKENKILPDPLLGFKSGNRTSDAHLILHNLIRNQCHKKGKYLYTCFVDFSKAFDTIPRDILMHKLLDKGINGKAFNLLKNIYSHEKCQIKIGEFLSKPISSNQGVRQGCILSPILFNIFISDLPGILDKPENHSPYIDDSKKLGCILWADDLVLLSLEEKGLHKMISDLCHYADENGLTINNEKTKCIIFNKTGRLIKKSFKIHNLIIDSVKEYKYLGFLITPSGEILTGLRDLKSRASYALVQLRKKLGINFRKHPNITIYLFDSLVKPILMYLSDFWACLTPKNNPIETVHHSFLKQLLGVQQQTSNTGVLLETGRVPLTLFAQRNCVKNWERITSNKCNPLITLSYCNMVYKDIIWYKRLDSSLSRVGLQYIMFGGENQPPHAIYFRRLTDIFHQDSFAEINNEKSKLRTYSLIKTFIRMEPYITKIRNENDRIEFTKLRLSNHKLRIETGRHDGINKDIRFCKFCPNHVENEIHFMTTCSQFNILRDQLMSQIKENNPSIVHLDDKSLFTFLMNDEKIAPSVAKYITRTMQLRDFLLRQHKTHD